jgi:hypothetical protein
MGAISVLKEFFMLNHVALCRKQIDKIKILERTLAHLCLHDLKGKDKDLEKFISTILSHKYDRRKL